MNHPASTGRIDRRRFLRRAATTGGATLGLPSLIPGSALGLNGAVAPGNRIVLGSIGVGNMGTGHVRSFLRHADTRLVAVCDVRESHRRRAKDRVDDYYGDAACSMYDDFRELLAREDVDAVVIAVPDHWHALIGLEAARRGKDMYYEKPMAMSVAEGQAVRRAVHRYGVIFQFGTQQRSSENYRLACELVRNGRIGRLETMMIGSAVPPHMPLQPSQPVPPGTCLCSRRSRCRRASITTCGSARRPGPRTPTSAARATGP
jgi:hypothetical protein